MAHDARLELNPHATRNRARKPKRPRHNELLAGTADRILHGLKEGGLND